MMLLKRFVQMFGRAQPADREMMEKTRLTFTVNEFHCTLQSVEFNINSNTWTVRLVPPQVPDETVKQAIQSLRDPHHSFKQVPNVVRQSLADMIELLIMRGKGNA